MLTGHMFIPSSTIKKVIVTLHGYGADGEDFFDVGRHFAQNHPLKNEIAVYSPNAIEPYEMGGSGYQWFGLPDLAAATLENGVHKAIPVLVDYLTHIKEKHSIEFEDMTLFGFSQGCMLALACMYHLPLGNVIGASGTWIRPFNPVIKKPKTRVFLTHGMLDMVVPYGALAVSQACLLNDGIVAETLSIPGLAHTVDATVLKGCLDFILENI
ncbi:MAG: hypothetical protein NEHIOOID_01188 [Holosporales bacterium]